MFQLRSAESFSTLRCAQDVRLDHDLAEEILKYAPVLVLYPNGPDYERPTKAESDYHPCRVEAFLDGKVGFTSRPRSSAFVTKFILYYYVAYIAAAIGLVVLGVLEAKDWPHWALVLFFLSLLLFPTVAVVAGIPIYKWVAKIVTHKSSAKFLAKYVADHVHKSELRDSMLDSGESDPEAAWRRYQAWKKFAHLGPRAYVHVIKQHKRLAIQYWFFYYFNDAFNYHQADWEFITVFLARKDGTYKPKGCAYSAHHGGTFRSWCTMEGRPGVGRADDTHPIAYVAKGSHAFYFESRKNGYFTSFPAEIGIPGLAFVDAKVSGDPNDPHARDYVPYVSHDKVRERLQANGNPEPGETYDIEMFPDLDTVVPANELMWNKWWWLKFRGWWSPYNKLPYTYTPVLLLKIPLAGLLTRPSVHGPPHQGDKWSDPWGWASETCHVDVHVTPIDLDEPDEAEPSHA